MCQSNIKRADSRDRNYDQSIEKLHIPANPKLISLNVPYCDVQHEISFLPVKILKFLTPFKNHRRNLVAHWSARGGHASVTLHQNLRNFITDLVPSSNLPWKVPTITNQARKSYVAALSSKSIVSQAEHSQRKSFAHKTPMTTGLPLRSLSCIWESRPLHLSRKRMIFFLTI